MSIERRFDIPLVAAMALKEKQIQQNYRPIIAVHKWFARRPGTLFRGAAALGVRRSTAREIFFQANDFRASGSPILSWAGHAAASRPTASAATCMGFDINPMATWIVREEIEHLDLDGVPRGGRHAACAP